MDMARLDCELERLRWAFSEATLVLTDAAMM